MLLLCLPRDSDYNFALLRKLDGIAYQVRQHLSQAAGITCNLVRNVSINIEDEFETFLLSPEGQRSHRFAEAPSQIELHALEIQFARLDFGKIKNVIDDRQQRVGARFHDS